MPSYANLGGNSNVVSWDDVAPDAIEVTFAGRAPNVYLYTASSCGQANIDTMKRLAAAGRGLNSFIVRRVGKNYASKR